MKETLADYRERLRKYRTRSLGGSLVIIKGLNDCAIIERLTGGRFAVVSTEGEWTADELSEAKRFWNGSEAQRR